MTAVITEHRSSFLHTYKLFHLCVCVCVYACAHDFIEDLQEPELQLFRPGNMRRRTGAGNGNKSLFIRRVNKHDSKEIIVNPQISNHMNDSHPFVSAAEEFNTLSHALGVMEVQMRSKSEVYFI